MNHETKADRKRRLARDRKRNQRKRDAAQRQALGSKSLTLELFQGTREALASICLAGGFAQPAEALTLLIHNAAELAERDPSRFAELVSTRSHS